MTCVLENADFNRKNNQLFQISILNRNDSKADGIFSKVEYETVYQVNRK